MSIYVSVWRFIDLPHLYLSLRETLVRMRMKADILLVGTSRSPTHTMRSFSCNPSTSTDHPRKRYICPLQLGPGWDMSSLSKGLRRGVFKILLSNSRYDVLPRAINQGTVCFGHMHAMLCKLLYCVRRPGWCVPNPKTLVVLRDLVM